MHSQLFAPFAGVVMVLCATACRAQASDPVPTEEWRLNLGGVSHHASDTSAAGHHWNEVNPGVGIEWRRAGVPMTDAGEQWHTIATAGYFLDSRDYRSAYAGMAATYELARLGRTRVDGGAGAFLFYRSRSWDGRMQWSPAVLPVLNFTDVRTGLGFEIIWRPPHTDGPSTLYLQVTIRLGPDHAAPAAAARRSTDEDVRARFAWKMRSATAFAFDRPAPDTTVLGGPPAPR